MLSQAGSALRSGARPLRIATQVSEDLVELAYHAAVLDTEGSLAFGQTQFHYSVEQVGDQWIEDLAGSAGVGRVYLKAARNKRAQPSSEWKLFRKADLLSYLTLLQPFVRKKKQEVAIALELLNGRIGYDTARSRAWKARAQYPRRR